MSMILILTDQLGGLDTEKLARLGSLGVTNVTLLEEASTAGVLIQGWAFGRTSAREAVDILTSGAADVRVLEPVMQVSVAPSGIVQTPFRETGTKETEGR